MKKKLLSKIESNNSLPFTEDDVYYFAFSNNLDKKDMIKVENALSELVNEKLLKIVFYNEFSKDNVFIKTSPSNGYMKSYVLY